MVAARPGTPGCERQGGVRSSWRDFKATSGSGSGGDGPEFGCVGPRSAGKGKAFAHSAPEEFPQFFKLQEERFVREGGMR